jgi:CO/xanthine dehydrogenase FAD-binding subunit
MTGHGYVRARHLGEALAALGRAPHRVLAGGTDVYPASDGPELRGPVLDISQLQGVRGIDGSDPRVLRIGALTTWSDLLRNPVPRHARALVQAAREIGGVQIQNRGTLGGNLCNASPAADGVPPLLVLDAQVRLASPRGERSLPLDRFVLGNRRTALAPDELLVAIDVPARSARAVSGFLKLGHRRYLVISIVMVAALLDFDDAGRVSHCAVAVGACSAAARRLPGLEAGLIGGRRADVPERTAALLDGDALGPLAPIDDVRGTRAYRLDAARSLVLRALTELAREVPA